jgi:UDP-N-acetylglucosamine acyltransferase
VQDDRSSGRAEAGRLFEMTVQEIHGQAVIAASARLGAGVKVGAYAVIGEDVELGGGCVVHPHAMINGPSTFGRDNVFYPYSVIGGDPQDITFRGERTELACGDANTFREYVTVTRGTAKGGGVTRVGSGNLFLSSSHVGHDCQVGNQTLFVNGATLAGHVTVEDFATVGAFSPVHQFCRIGRYAYVGAATVVTQDVPPFSLIVTERETKCYGANTIGLERKGFSPERVKVLQQAFRWLLRSKLNTSQALARMREELRESEDVRELVRFIETAERGIVK